MRVVVDKKTKLTDGEKFNCRRRNFVTCWLGACGRSEHHPALSRWCSTLSTGNSLSLTDVGKYLQNNLTQHYMVCALCILIIQNVQAHTGATATVTRNRRCALHTVQGWIKGLMNDLIVMNSCPSGQMWQLISVYHPCFISWMFFVAHAGVSLLISKLELFIKADFRGLVFFIGRPYAVFL